MAALFSILAPSISMGGNNAIYQCDGKNGEPVFSNSGCDNNPRIISLGEPSIIEGSSAQALRQQAKAVRDLPVEKRAKTNASAARRKVETFAGRVELRKLTMRAEGLRRDLRRAVSGGARLTLKKELHDVERQLKQLRQSR
jgi:hypothetical protein